MTNHVGKPRLHRVIFDSSGNLALHKSPCNMSEVFEDSSTQALNALRGFTRSTKALTAAVKAENDRVSAEIQSLYAERSKLQEKSKFEEEKKILLEMRRLLTSLIAIQQTRGQRSVGTQTTSETPEHSEIFHRSTELLRARE